MPPVPTPGAPDAGAHTVQFYESSDELCDAVTDFLAAGAAAGQPLLVIATEPHRQALGDRLRARSVEDSDLTFFDASETLARFMVDGEPDRERFTQVVGGALLEVGRRRPGVPVRAYGEMVDVLWREGNQKAALLLESLWNDLQRRQSFSLYCAYVMGSFYKAADLEAICRSHDHVVRLPDSAASAGDSGPLLAEISERVRVEEALRSSLDELGRARDQVRLRERQLETITDSLPTLVSFVDAGGRYRFANRAYESWFGVPREDLMGRHLREVVGDAAFESLRPRVEAALAGESVTFQERVPYGVGERFVEATYVPNRGPGGAVLGFTALVSDISERRRLESARSAGAEQRQRLLAITAAIAEAVTREEVFEAVVDQAAVALGASSAGLFLLADDDRTVRLVRSTGYRPESIPQIDGRPVDGAVRLPALDTIEGGEPMWIDSQQELIAAYPHLAAYVSPERSYRIACLPVRSQGRTLGSLAFTFESAPAIDDGQKSFLLLTARYGGQALERLRLLEGERKARAQAEEARARSELLHQLARAIIMAHGVGDVYDAALATIGRALSTERAAVLLFDHGGVMRFVAQRGLSEAYQRAVEGHSPWRPDEVDPQPVLVPDVTADPDLAGFQALFASEGIGALGFFPLVAGGRLLGKFMVYHDRARAFAPQEVELAMAIANHVGAAVVRFSALDQLERTVRFNEMFTGILGHDLRNPLHAIMTAANVALLRAEGERNLKPISRILRSGERMSRMIDQLLDFTRVRTGAGLPLEPRAIDLVTLVGQVADELEDGNPDWRFTLDAMGDAVGSWDPDRLAQVFSNLIGNAVQHGVAAGGVRVRIDGTESERVTVAVHNHGAIPPDLLPRVFEPMSGAETRRARSQGLGLGLFITDEVARAHGGAVTVESSEECGTTFTVILPRLTTPEAR